jgi:hypothetical protein
MYVDNLRLRQKTNYPIVRPYGRARIRAQFAAESRDVSWPVTLLCGPRDLAIRPPMA